MKLVPLGDRVVLKQVEAEETTASGIVLPGQAQETITSMQAGLMYGQIGQTEYIIRKVKEESGLAELKVVATGGLGRAIADETDSIDIYDSSLTLDGLRIIYDKNRR